MALSVDDCQKVDCGWVAGQVPPDLAFRIATDLTGFTIILQLQQPDGTVIQKTAVIDSTSATESTFHVSFLASDVVEGLSKARLTQTNPSGQSSLMGEFVIEVQEAWS